jgi:alkylation response protein AidB-like acyl-CoA dehydrogenase
MGYKPEWARPTQQILPGFGGTTEIQREIIARNLGL